MNSMKFYGLLVGLMATTWLTATPGIARAPVSTKSIIGKSTTAVKKDRVKSPTRPAPKKAGRKKSSAKSATVTRGKGRVQARGRGPAKGKGRVQARGRGPAKGKGRVQVRGRGPAKGQRQAQAQALPLKAPVIQKASLTPAVKQAEAPKPVVNKPVVSPAHNPVEPPKPVVNKAAVSPAPNPVETPQPEVTKPAVNAADNSVETPKPEVNPSNMASGSSPSTEVLPELPPRTQARTQAEAPPLPPRRGVTSSLPPRTPPRVGITNPSGGNTGRNRNQPAPVSATAQQTAANKFGVNLRTTSKSPPNPSTGSSTNTGRSVPGVPGAATSAQPKTPGASVSAGASFSSKETKVSTSSTSPTVVTSPFGVQLKKTGKALVNPSTLSSSNTGRPLAVPRAATSAQPKTSGSAGSPTPVASAKAPNVGAPPPPLPRENAPFNPSVPMGSSMSITPTKTATTTTKSPLPDTPIRKTKEDIEKTKKDLSGRAQQTQQSLTDLQSKLADLQLKKASPASLVTAVEKDQLTQEINKTKQAIDAERKKSKEILEENKTLFVEQAIFLAKEAEERAKRNGSDLQKEETKLVTLRKDLKAAETRLSEVKQAELDKAALEELKKEKEAVLRHPRSEEKTKQLTALSKSIQELVQKVSGAAKDKNPSYYEDQIKKIKEGIDKAEDNKKHHPQTVAITLKTDRHKIEEDVKALRSKLQQVKEKASAERDETLKENFEKQIQDITSQIRAEEKTFGQLELVEAQLLVSKTEIELQSKETEKKNLETKKSQIATQLLTLQATVKKLGAEIDAEKANKNKATALLQKRQIQGVISAKEGEQRKAQSTIKSLENEKVSVESNFKALERQKETLTTQLSKEKEEAAQLGQRIQKKRFRTLGISEAPVNVMAVMSGKISTPSSSSTKPAGAEEKKTDFIAPPDIDVVLKEIKDTVIQKIATEASDWEWDENTQKEERIKLGKKQLKQETKKRKWSSLPVVKDEWWNE